MFRRLWWWMQDRPVAAIWCGAGVGLGIVCLLLLALALGDGPPIARSEVSHNVEVKRAISGHKVKLESDEELVYAGIRAPYPYEPFHEESLRRNAELVDDKDVRLRYDGEHLDRKGRLCAYVFVDGEFVNETLVREGLAYVRLTPQTRRFSKELLAAQAEARKERRGLWRNATPSTAARYPADPKYGAFHHPDCEEVPKIKAERLTEFKTKDAAFDSGCAPCSKCQP